MKTRGNPVPAPIEIEPVIRTIRGIRVILDTDLARLYSIPTFRLNEAVKRNRGRFPEDFMFQLTKEERDVLTSQNAMSKGGRGGRRTLPYAFTEHGAVMAANRMEGIRAGVGHDSYSARQGVEDGRGRIDQEDGPGLCIERFDVPQAVFLLVRAG